MPDPNQCQQWFYSWQYYQTRANMFEAMRAADQTTADGYMAQYEAGDCPPLAAPPVPGQEMPDDFKEFQQEVEAIAKRFESRHSKPPTV